MRPVLFRWRGLTMWSYPAMLYVGMVAGVAAGNLAAHRAHIDAFRVYVATFLLLVPALAGARLLYVAVHWRTFRGQPNRIWSRREGGAAQYGGLLVTLPLSLPLLAMLRLPIGSFWDVAAITILVGMIFTRVGCFLNGCCAGRPVKRWGVRLPDSRGVWERRVPTQCLEALWAALLLGGAVLAWNRLPFAGAVFLLVAGGYAMGRLGLESARDRQGAGRFSAQHAISLLIAVASFATLTIRWTS